MAAVYVVQHTRPKADGGEDVKLLGAYSSRENAEKAVYRFRNLPGFIDTADGFNVDEYQVDQDYWQEGFGS
jgi:hypothetical protein